MPPIPDMKLETALDTLSDQFQRKIHEDLKFKKCIWCKAGGGKKNNHALIDCPTAYPLASDRTLLSNEIFNAGRQDAAVRYIHHLQLGQYARQDSATNFSAGLTRAQMATYTVPVPTAPAPSAHSHNTITQVPSSRPPSVPSTSADQVSSGFTSSSIVPTAGSTPAATAPTQFTEGQMSQNMTPGQPQTGVVTQSTAFAQSPAPSAVPNVNLLDAPTINFGEVAHFNEAPAASGYNNGNPVHVDSGLAKSLSALEGTSKYPLRTSLRAGPGKGTVIMNHFQMAINPSVTFYEYRIIGIPASESRIGKKRYMETTIQSVPFLSQNTGSFATDNVDTIVSWENLHKHATSVQIMPNDPVTGTGGEWKLVDIIDRNTTTHLNFHYLRQIDIASLHSYAGTMHTDPTAYDPSPAENALNIIMAKCITNNNTLHLNNHKFYVRDAFQDLKTSEQNAIAPLRALRGYSYRVHPAMDKILLNVSPANSAFWKPQLVNLVLLHGQGPFGNTSEDVTRALRNVRVYVVYERDSKDKKCRHPRCTDTNCRAGDRTDMVSMDVQHARLKTIRGFGTACNQQTFVWEHKDAQGNAIAGHNMNTTVSKYQSRQYGRTLQYPRLPAVNVGTTLKPTWFAPEDLRIVPDQIYAKIIPDTVATDFHHDACRRPAEIRSRIEQEAFRHIPVNATNTLLGCAAIRVTPVMLQIPSVRLPYPTILYGNSTAAANKHSGQWNLQGTTFLQRNTSDVSWKLILGPGVQYGSATLLTKDFNVQLRQTGVTLNAGNEGAPLALHNATEAHLKDTIRTYLATLKKQKMPVPDIFILLMVNKNQELYSSFKYLADKVFVFQSICMTMASMRGANITQYMANVAMKANLKMAGINHSAQGIDTWLDKTLVLGADCTHPGSGAVKDSPSVTAVVGSLEANGGRFCGKLTLQPGKQEIINDLENFLHDHFTHWYTYHGNKFPENVLYYRDGVGTSQYDEVIDTELAGIEKAFENLVRDKGGKDVKKLKTTAVIVNKRHSTRFFPQKEADGMSNGNCKPGLLVDSVITSPYYTDFYLQSHHGIKGTARSAHYTVIRNDMTMTTNELEDLVNLVKASQNIANDDQTHKLNHTYARATLGVSYAAPAYYADRLCERARCYLRPWYNPDNTTRSKYHNQLLNVERQVEMNRNRTNANTPRRTRGHKKTDEEVKAEKDDAEIVDRMMHAQLKPDYHARWDVEPDDVVRDPEGAKRRFEQTMYWM